jgi:hypothetical protein
VGAQRVEQDRPVGAAGELDAPEAVLDAVQPLERAPHRQAARAARVQQRVIDVEENDAAHNLL